MASPQRFNVAITRAKALLVIIGDPNALWEDASWRELLQYAVDHNSYRGCPQPLRMTGAEDETLDAIAGLIEQRAARTLPGDYEARATLEGHRERRDAPVARRVVAKVDGLREK